MQSTRTVACHGASLGGTGPTELSGPLHHWKNRLSLIQGLLLFLAAWATSAYLPPSFQLPQKVERQVFPDILWGTFDFALGSLLPSGSLLEERSEFSCFPLKRPVFRFLFY